MKTNLNHLARDIAKREGGAVDLTIAQVKDVLAAIGERWREHPELALIEAAAIAERAGKEGKP